LSLALAVKQRATRSALLTRCLFGVRTEPLGPGNRYFDLTTLALKRVASARIERGARVLDMGTGTSAVLGLWLARALACEVTCTDVDPRTVERARANVARNEVSLTVVCASLFEGVEETFDYVLFNPPYLPTATGRERDQPEELRSMWDGGPEGTDTIAAFLDAFSARDSRATVLLGVNRVHVGRERVTALIGARDPLDLRAVEAHPWLPVDVYVLVKKKSPSASASTPLA
jgi:methylase of polypeptide subunit release factors